MQHLKDTKTELVAGIISDNINGGIGRILVVGCGSGVEAALLARTLKTDVVGIDVEDNFDPESARQAELKIDDAMSLSFEDNSFDFVYSYHALEHIPDPALALAEMRRVLNDGGSYWIGTPNRLRVIGYLGSKTATPGQKIKWNLIDWKAKLAGRFRNELGAHAGYSPAELRSMLENIFSNTKDVTNTYYHVLYARHMKVLHLLELSGLSTFLYPSVYFMGNK